MNTINVEALGLTTIEGEVYEALLSVGQCNACELSRHMKLSRVSVYDALGRLKRKGLVFDTSAGRTILYQAANPSIFIQKHDQRREEVEKSVRALRIRKSQHEHRSGSTVVSQGKQSVKILLEQILKYKEYVSFGGSKGHSVMGSYYHSFQRQKKRQRMNCRIICSQSIKKSKSVKESTGEIKFIPYNFSRSITIFIFGKNTAIILWNENPTIVQISDKTIAEGFKSIFELVWRFAKK